MKTTLTRLIVLLPLAFSGCTEPYALQTRNFESALVIEATVTNEMKQQKIKISRTYRLSEEGPNFETGATVNLEDDLGNTIDFEEATDSYVSEVIFAPDPDRSYTLHITTSDGKSYSSEPEKLTAATADWEVTRTRTFLGEDDSVQIAVNAFDPTGNSKYYHYDYEEAGKIIVPYYVDQMFVWHADGPDVQNLSSYTFYKTMGELSSTGDLLSQNQPGFFFGNIRSDDNPNEKVIGFFEVSAFSEKIIAFDHNEMFPDLYPPEFPEICVVNTYFSDLYAHISFDTIALLNEISANTITYYQTDPIGNYVTVSSRCGDCTRTGQLEPPYFCQD